MNLKMPFHLYVANEPHSWVWLKDFDGREAAIKAGQSMSGWLCIKVERDVPNEPTIVVAAWIMGREIIS